MRLGNAVCEAENVALEWAHAGERKPETSRSFFCGQAANILTAVVRLGVKVKFAGLAFGLPT